MKKHHKHPPIARPKIGKFYKLEWAIYGTNCGAIESFYTSIENHFKSEYTFTYVDADHSDEVKNTLLQVGKKKYLKDAVIAPNMFDDKFNHVLSQAVFINGNHYPGSRQIVIIDSKKRDSLERRVEQLNQIDILIVEESEDEIFDFVKAKLNDNSLVYTKGQMDKVFSYLEQEIKANLPQLKALVLAGGKSSRMKEDKSKLQYHGSESQEVYLAKMCNEIGLETFISKSHTSEEDSIDGFQVLKDKYVEMGPFGAILSAFMSDPDSAWMVLACDLPFMSKLAIERLIEERSIRTYATAYRLDENPFPEPLIAIYEPSVYRRMLQFLSLGYACPRKVLINSDVKHVILNDHKIAFNANTPEEKASVMNQLNK